MAAEHTESDDEQCRSATTVRRQCEDSRDTSKITVVFGTLVGRPWKVLVTHPRSMMANREPSVHCIAATLRAIKDMIICRYDHVAMRITEKIIWPCDCVSIYPRGREALAWDDHRITEPSWGSCGAISVEKVSGIRGTDHLAHSHMVAGAMVTGPSDDDTRKL